jgi:peptidoglycan/xylan/chitin deacetylase (PgdA/CDA1 family)
MYHYVRPDDPSLPHFRHMTVDAFEQQLDYFSDRHRLLSRDEFERCIETRTPIEDGIVLTFDDGMKDHFEYVLPALTRRGTFGVFYVAAYPYSTGRILDVHRAHLLLGRHGGKAVWQVLLKHITDDMLSDAYVEEFRKKTYRNQTNDDYTREVKRTLNYYIDYRFRPQILDALMAEFFPEEADVAARFYISENQMRQMREAGMILGSHTVTHPCMSKLAPEEQKKEIEDSFSHLERVLGNTRPKTFCYPYGGFHSFTDETEHLLQDAGCAFSFNVEPRDITATDLERRPQALPRYDCNMFPPLKSR